MRVTESDHQMALPDGRRMSWAELGDPRGRPVLCLHGTPGSRRQLAPFDEKARAEGVRVIAPDRPGTGLSDPVPGGTGFLQYSDDLRHLLEHLALERITLLGVSGGGGFALGAAAAMPDKVARLVLACPMVPAPREALAGRDRPISLAFLLARVTPRLLASLMRKQLSVDWSGPRGQRLLAKLPEEDRAAMEVHATTGDHLEVLRQGPRAAVQELRRYARGPLGFSLATIDVDVVILHGDRDVSVPLRLAQWLAQEIPGARLDVVAGAGHMFLVLQPELALDWVVA